MEKLYPRTIWQLSVFLLLLLIFSCSKDLEKTETASTDKLEKPSAPFYNRELIPIDLEVLSLLQKDTLFNEYVRLLDYRYLTHLTDSLRKATSSQDEFYTIYQDIIRERAGDIKERFNKVKDSYPKDFFRYVNHQSRFKKNITRMDQVNVDGIFIDGLDGIYDQMAQCYNQIYGAVLGLAYESYRLYSTKIKQCSHYDCNAESKLLASTIDAVFMQMGGVGGFQVAYVQGFSDNFTHYISGQDIKRMVIKYDIKFNCTLGEIKENSNICVGLITSVITWNPYFELAFVDMMSCWNDGGGGDSGGGGTGGDGGNPSPDPDPECTSGKCNICNGCLNSNCSICSSKCNGHEATINLTISETAIDISDTYNLAITNENFSSNESISDIAIEVRRQSDNNWMIIDNSNYSVQKTAKASGFWVYRAKLNYNGKILMSNEVVLEVQYPTLKKIVVAVGTILDDIWRTTKSFVNPNNPNSGRREFGCWIYVNTINGNSTIECGPTLEGPIVYGGEGTNGSLPPGSPEGFGSGNPITGERRAIAFFHTHTPLAHLSDCTRVVGFSPSDKNYSDNNKVPLIMYDYKGKNGRINAGHGIDDPFEVYYYKSENSRFATMLF